MKRTAPPEESTASARPGYGPFFGSGADLDERPRRSHPVAGVLMLLGAVGAIAFALVPHSARVGIPALRVLESVRPLLQSNHLDVTFVGLGYGATAGFGVLLLIAALFAFKSSERRRIAVFGLLCAFGLCAAAVLLAVGSRGIVFDGFWGWVAVLAPIPALIGAAAGFARS